MQYGSQTQSTTPYGGLITGVIAPGTQTQDGLASLICPRTKNMSGRANINFETLSEINQYGTASILYNVNNNLEGKSLIQINYLKVRYGKASIVATFDNDLDGLAYIVVPTPVDATLNGKAALKQATSQTLTGKARISLGTTDWNPIAKPADTVWVNIDKPSSAVWTPINKPYR